MSKLIDSPFEICPVCDQYVLLDQTQKECAREHRCKNVQCPLQRFFVGREMRNTAADDTDRADVGKKAVACAEN